MPAAPDLSRHLPSPPARLRLSSPAEVLAAVPYLIGFTPKRSLVVLCLRAKRVGLTMRLDLDVPPEELRSIVLGRLALDDADTAVIILFDPDSVVGSRRPGAATARGLVRAVRRAGIEVKDALGVAEGVFWSYLCQEPSCCPPEGRPVPAPGAPDHSKVAASFVATGGAPYASREELVASIAYVAGARSERLEAQFAAAGMSADPIRAWRAAVARYTAGPPRPGSGFSDPDAAELIGALDDDAVRDEVIGWACGDELTGLLAVLRELAPLSPPLYAVQVLAALAWAAFSFGDGALAAVALERALGQDREHRLARLLASALDTGVTPAQLRSISRELGGSVSGRTYPKPTLDER